MSQARGDARKIRHAVVLTEGGRYRCVARRCDRTGELTWACAHVARMKYPA